MPDLDNVAIAQFMGRTEAQISSVGRSIDTVREVMIQRFEALGKEINYRFEENAKSAEMRAQDQGRRIGSVEAAQKDLAEKQAELQTMILEHASVCGSWKDKKVLAAAGSGSGLAVLIDYVLHALGVL